MEEVEDDKSVANTLFPETGTVFIERSNYVHQKLKLQQTRLLKTLLFSIIVFGVAISLNMLIVAVAILSFNSAYFFNQISTYMTLKKVAQTNPLLRISDDGLSWWDMPETTLSWNDIGTFVRRASKIYALPRLALFRQDIGHRPIMCIDTALLKTNRDEILKYLESRLHLEHNKKA